jgi:hypothetical protein
MGRIAPDWEPDGELLRGWQEISPELFSNLRSRFILGHRTRMGFPAMSDGAGS